MGKELLAALGAITTAAVGAPAGVLLGAESVTISNEPKNERWIPELTTIASIKDNYLKNNCLKNYSDEIKKWGEVGTSENPEFNLENILDKDIKSCLMVEYYKQTFDGNKWSGDFKLVWTLGSEFEELAVIFSSKTENGKLSINYEFYFLKIENDKWTAKSKKEDSVRDVSNSSALPQWLPKSGKAISGFSSENYWDFFTNLEKICGNEECKETSTKVPTQVSNAWGWKMGSGSVKITDWNANFDSWLDSLFPSLSNVKERLKKIPNGIWKETKNKR